MRKLFNIFKGRYDFSYLLDKSVNLMKYYRTDVTKYNYYDLVVKKIRKDHDSMSGWIGYISDSLLKISEGETMLDQRIMIKKCIINQIEICLLSQEFMLDFHTREDLKKIANLINNDGEIDKVKEEQATAYLLSQATIFTLEFLLISEYNEKNSEWAYVFSYIHDQWLRTSIQMILEENYESKVMLSIVIKPLNQLKLDYCNSIYRGETHIFDTNEIDRYNLSTEGLKKPGVMHCRISAS